MKLDTGSIATRQSIELYLSSVLGGYNGDNLNQAVPKVELFSLYTTNLPRNEW